MHSVSSPLTCIACSVYLVEVSLTLYHTLVPLALVVTSIAEVLCSIPVSETVLPFTLVLFTSLTHMSITVIVAISHLTHVYNAIVTVELAFAIELVVLELP